MVSEAPPFWWEPSDWRALALSPLGAAYGAVAAWRMKRGRREKIGAPVLCVGNFTVGGAGKTPVSIALARAAIRLGRRPGFLSRGHGGTLGAPHLVDAHHDAAKSVGDEPLLLARVAPVAVTPDRGRGAGLLLAEGCDFLIMDDGFQSQRLHFDLAALVVDGRRGLGNGHVLPAGPLRAPLAEQLRLADVLIRVGDGPGSVDLVRRVARAGRPIHLATTRPVPRDDIAGGRFLAFAGIGDPQKFFETLRTMGGEIAIAKPFPDHHAYADDELADLMADADKAGLLLATTAKDAARLAHGSPTAATLLQRAKIIEIETVFDLPRVPELLVSRTVEAYRKRALAFSPSPAARAMPD